MLGCRRVHASQARRAPASRSLVPPVSVGATVPSVTVMAVREVAAPTTASFWGGTGGEAHTVAADPSARGTHLRSSSGSTSRQQPMRARATHAPPCATQMLRRGRRGAAGGRDVGCHPLAHSLTTDWRAGRPGWERTPTAGAHAPPAQPSAREEVPAHEGARGGAPAAAPVPAILGGRRSSGRGGAGGGSGVQADGRRAAAAVQRAQQAGGAALAALHAAGGHGGGGCSAAVKLAHAERACEWPSRGSAFSGPAGCPPTRPPTRPSIHPPGHPPTAATM